MLTSLDRFVRKKSAISQYAVAVKSLRYLPTNKYIAKPRVYEVNVVKRS